MEQTELMIYNAVSSNSASGEGEHSFSAILAMIVGLIGILATGGVLPGDASELMPMIAATAAPGLVAWILTYLYAATDNTEELEEALAQ